MREKILRLMALTIGPVDDVVAKYVQHNRDQWVTGFGEALPPDAAAALDLVEKTLKEKKGELENSAVALYSAQLSESDVDAIVAFHESEVGRRLADASAAIQAGMNEVTEEWLKNSFSSIEGELQALLGPAVQTPSAGTVQAPSPNPDSPSQAPAEAAAQTPPVA